MKNFRYGVNRFFSLPEPAQPAESLATAGSPAPRAPVSEARKNEILASPSQACKRYFDTHERDVKTHRERQRRLHRRHVHNHRNEVPRSRRSVRLHHPFHDTPGNDPHQGSRGSPLWRDRPSGARVARLPHKGLLRNVIRFLPAEDAALQFKTAHGISREAVRNTYRRLRTGNASRRRADESAPTPPPAIPDAETATRNTDADRRYRVARRLAEAVQQMPKVMQESSSDQFIACALALPPARRFAARVPAASPARRYTPDCRAAQTVYEYHPDSKPHHHSQGKENVLRLVKLFMASCTPSL